MSDSSIVFDEVQKRFGEGSQSILALDGISFDIGREEFVSIVGPSGCGKTTLLHLTASLIAPTAGGISIDGTDVTSDDHRKSDVGLVFQQPVLLEWRTVRKNILLPIEIMSANGIIETGTEDYQKVADELLKLVGLEGFGDAYPRELSGGMQQRAAICRSLIYDPPVLLMDEPFGALDALTRNEMNNELLKIWRETRKTVMFVTHDLDEAIFLSDRVVVLSARPGQIRDIVTIDLPRPRSDSTRTGDRYNRLVANIHEYFRSEQ